MKKNIILHPNIKRDALAIEPIIIRVTKFNESGLEDFAKELEKIRQARQSIIPIIIDSYGGEVYSLFGMVSLLRDAKERIVTYVGSKAMSCGAVLASCGSPDSRFMSEFANVLIHSPSTWDAGKIGDLEVTVNHGKQLRKTLFEIMSRNAGQEKNYFKKLVNKHLDRDLFLTPKECIEHGIADRIGIPTLTISVEQKCEISV